MKNQGDHTPNHHLAVVRDINWLEFGIGWKQLHSPLLSGQAFDGQLTIDSRNHNTPIGGLDTSVYQ